MPRHAKLYQLLSQNQEPFWSKNLYKNYFSASLMHRESKKPRKRRMIGKSTLFSELTVYHKQWTKKMWISVLMQWWIQGRGPGSRALPYSPYYWTKLRPEGPKHFFWETTPLPATYHRVWMTGPPVIWRSGSASIMSHFSCSLQESSCQSNDASWCHTASNSLDCQRACHCTSTMPRKLPKEYQTF